MIELYSGTPGSGKSFHVIEDIVLFLRKNRHVISNFDITYKHKKGSFVYREFLTPDFLIDYSKKYFKPFKEHQGLLVIDEAQIVFNCRDYASKDRRSWISFFTQHRKYGYDVILISQYDRFLDRQIRACIEYNTIHRKLNNSRYFKWLPFSVFLYLRKWYGVNEKDSLTFHFYNRKYGKMYNTFNTFGGENNEKI